MCCVGTMEIVVGWMGPWWFCAFAKVGALEKTLYLKAKQTAELRISLLWVSNLFAFRLCWKLSANIAFFEPYILYTTWSKLGPRRARPIPLPHRDWQVHSFPQGSDIPMPKICIWQTQIQEELAILDVSQQQQQHSYKI